MKPVTLSSKFQVVIPHSVRKSLGLKPGEKMQVIQYDGRVEFIPVKPTHAMRGFLKGINTEIETEMDRPCL